MKKCWYFCFIGLKLVKCLFDGSLLCTRIFKLYYGKWQTIYKDHNIRPPVSVVLNHRELVYRQPVVIFRVFGINEPYLVKYLSAALFI